MSKTVSDHWIGKLCTTMDLKMSTELKPINENITKIKEKRKEMVENMKKMELQLDDQEMAARDNNVIIEDLKEESREGVVQELNKLLELELLPKCQ